MRGILMLRTKWRELETEPRTRLNGHAGGTPGYSQAKVLTVISTTALPNALLWSIPRAENLAAISSRRRSRVSVKSSKRFAHCSWTML